MRSEIAHHAHRSAHMHKKSVEHDLRRDALLNLRGERTNHHRTNARRDPTLYSGTMLVSVSMPTDIMLLCAITGVHAKIDV